MAYNDSNTANNGTSQLCNCTALLSAVAGQSDTMSTPYLGPRVLQIDDFYQSESILHPLAIGSIVILALFVTLRLSSNRSVAPMTIFDVIINVGLGSTLAGIVNGNSLTRGLLGLSVLLFFQFITSYSSCYGGKFVRTVLNSPPLVIVFRGRCLDKVMRRHRITMVDLNGAMRNAKVWNIDQIECVVLEATGAFSIYKTSDLPKDVVPEVLLAVPAYRALVEAIESGDSDKSDRAKSQANEGDVPSSVRGVADASHTALRGQAEKFKYSDDKPSTGKNQQKCAETIAGTPSSSSSEEQSTGANTAVGSDEGDATNGKGGSAVDCDVAQRHTPQRRRTGLDGQGRTAVGTDQENEIAQHAS